jgi:hypothetical protein
MLDDVIPQSARYRHSASVTEVVRASARWITAYEPIELCDGCLAIFRNQLPSWRYGRTTFTIVSKS